VLKKASGRKKTKGNVKEKRTYRRQRQPRQFIHTIRMHEAVVLFFFVAFSPLWDLRQRRFLPRAHALKKQTLYLRPNVTSVLQTLQRTQHRTPLLSIL